MKLRVVQKSIEIAARQLSKGHFLRIDGVGARQTTQRSKHLEIRGANLRRGFRVARETQKTIEHRSARDP